MGNAVFAQRLKAERNKKGISMDALAKALGVNKSRVGMWETNGILPPDELVAKAGLC
ncbi:MAG: helix-turn-helix transcriptional regulator [Treponema sp.]|nr:helix-turn-helix transcriptional regulator [Treponema sp.]